MVQPYEMSLGLPMEVANHTLSTTDKVWAILSASSAGDISKVKQLVAECPDLIYAQYNYTPPIHFAVREGHLEVVKYLLDNGAHNPPYTIYPFHDSLDTLALDRGFDDIASLLKQYTDSRQQRHRGDNGEIFFNRTPLQLEFERAVDKQDLDKTGRLLKDTPELALDQTYFWGEGILMFAAKENNQPLVDLLMSYGAKVPAILKWTQFYYFERLDGAAYMMENGMNPNTKSWQEVTILHDMAQKGDIAKAELLLKYGADINPVDDEYQSTPLGMAARWGHTAMVKFLLAHGADPNKAGAEWATPLAWATKKGHTEIMALLQ